MAIEEDGPPLHCDKCEQPLSSSFFSAQIQVQVEGGSPDGQLDFVGTESMREVIELMEKTPTGKMESQVHEYRNLKLCVACCCSWLNHTIFDGNLNSTVCQLCSQKEESGTGEHYNVVVHISGKGNDIRREFILCLSCKEAWINDPLENEGE